MDRDPGDVACGAAPNSPTARPPEPPERHPAAETAPASTLDDVLRLAGGILWESDAVDWRARHVSRTLHDIAGYDPGDWIAIREFWEDRVHPEDRATVFAVVDDGIGAGSGGPYEYRWRTGDGSWRWFRDRFTIIPGPDGQARMAGLMTDVTDEVEAVDEARRVREERDRLAAFMEQSTELIATTDAQGVITYVNPAFERTLGYRRADAVGKTLFELLGPDAPGTAERLAEAEAVLERFAEGRPWTGDLDLPAADGRIVRLMSAVIPVRDADGTVRSTIGFHRDVTRLRELEDQLAQAAKLEAIGQLAGGVAHDFNNILTAILGYASFIGASLPPDSPIQDDLREITAAGRRAQRLTGQLLAFGRRTVLRPEVVDVGALLTELFPMLRRLIGEDIDLRLQHPGPDRPAVAHVDAGQLEQAVINLVVNARNAMPAGGEIEVGVQVRATADASTPAEDWVVVSVADTGIGIAPEVMDRIFEPFFTTDEFGRGTGLGLAVVDGFVRQSAGHVRVSTQPGRGSTFELWLPVHATDAPGSARPTTAAPAPLAVIPAPQRPLTVLVAEDEAVVRAIARRALTLGGHRVLLASSGQEALDVAQRFEGAIDVLLSDVVMPGIRGPQLADELRRIRPGVRVVLASGYAPDEVARRGISLGAEAFLPKPYTVEALLAAVEGRREVEG